MTPFHLTSCNTQGGALHAGNCSFQPQRCAGELRGLATLLMRDCFAGRRRCFPFQDCFIDSQLAGGGVNLWTPPPLPKAKQIMLRTCSPSAAFVLQNLAQIFFVVALFV